MPRSLRYLKMLLKKWTLTFQKHSLLQMVFLWLNNNFSEPFSTCAFWSGDILMPSSQTAEGLAVCKAVSVQGEAPLIMDFYVRAHKAKNFCLSRRAEDRFSFHQRQTLVCVTLRDALSAVCFGNKICTLTNVSDKFCIETVMVGAVLLPQFNLTTSLSSLERLYEYILAHNSFVSRKKKVTK